MAPRSKLLEVLQDQEIQSEKPEHSKINVEYKVFSTATEKNKKNTTSESSQDLF